MRSFQSIDGVMELGPGARQPPAASRQPPAAGRQPPAASRQPPAASRQPPAASLIVTVDTEEEGLWSGVYRRSGNTVENIRGVERFQGVCERYGVRPSYLVDTPVAEDDRAVAILKALQDCGRCEVGAHLHPWCAPPFEEEVSARNSFLLNLSPDLQREKLRRLTDLIGERFGRRPTSFRAGRYGLDLAGARILSQLGYVVDSSVIAFSDFSGEGGPDFSRAPTAPYFLAGGDLVTPYPSGFLLEVPISVGFNRCSFRFAQRLRSLASSPLLKKLRVAGVLDRLGIVRRIKFSPEQSDAASLCRLADVYLQRSAPCLVLMLHSSSLVVGFSPYAPDAPSLERLYRDFELALEYCMGRRGMVSATLEEFARGFSGQVARVDRT
jgi:hypothetical protein